MGKWSIFFDGMAECVRGGLVLKFKSQVSSNLKPFWRSKTFLTSFCATREHGECQRGGHPQGPFFENLSPLVIPVQDYPEFIFPHIRIFDHGQLPPRPLDDLGGSGTPKGGHIRGWGGVEFGLNQKSLTQQQCRPVRDVILPFF